MVAAAPLASGGGGLLIDALAESAFDFLTDGIDALPETDDPVADLIAVGMSVVRRLVVERPALYRIAFQRIAGFRAGPEVTAARERAWSRLDIEARNAQVRHRLIRLHECLAGCDGAGELTSRNQVVGDFEDNQRLAWLPG